MQKWIIWGIVVLFYFYEFILRVSTSVLIPNMMESYHVDAEAIGVLSAFYFYAYAPLQIPVGLLVDRWGLNRLLVSFAILLLAIGCLTMSLSHHFRFVEIGRLLTGIGSAFAFVSLIYVSSYWFKGKHLALMIGLGTSSGLLGSIIGEGPLAFSAEVIGWRTSLFCLAVFGFALAALSWAYIPKKSPFKKMSPSFLKHEFKKIITSSQTWLNALTGFCFYAFVPAFASLWGVSFLKTAYGLSEETAGFTLSTIFVGWLIGNPIIGYISDRLKRRRLTLSTLIFFTMLLLITIIYIPNISYPALISLFFFLGFCGSGLLLIWSIAVEIKTHSADATAVAFTNSILSCSGIIISPLIGYFLDITWNGQMRDGIEYYDLASFHTALAILPALLLVALILSLFIKETNLAKERFPIAFE